MLKMSYPMNYLPPEYEDFQPKNYDPKFIADISEKMSMPNHLGIGGGSDEILSHRVSSYMPSESNAPYMDIPNKLVILGQGQSVGIKEEPELHFDLMPFPSDEFSVNVSTPPNVLTLAEHPDIMTVVEERHAGMDAYGSEKQNGWMDCPINGFNSKYAQFQPESETTVIRYQLSKLAQKIAKLERDNVWRSRREMILYPFLMGYVFFRVVQWAMKQ